MPVSYRILTRWKSNPGVTILYRIMTPLNTGYFQEKSRWYLFVKIGGVKFTFNIKLYNTFNNFCQFLIAACGVCECFCKMFVFICQPLPEKAGTKPNRFALVTEGKTYEISAPDFRTRTEWISGESHAMLCHVVVVYCNVQSVPEEITGNLLNCVNKISCYLVFC